MRGKSIYIMIRAYLMGFHRWSSKPNRLGKEILVGNIKFVTIFGGFLTGDVNSGLADFIENRSALYVLASDII